MSITVLSIEEDSFRIVPYTRDCFERMSSLETTPLDLPVTIGSTQTPVCEPRTTSAHDAGTLGLILA